MSDIDTVKVNSRHSKNMGPGINFYQYKFYEMPICCAIE